MEQKDVVIIGAGIGGLATACILSQAGYRVTIYEKNAQPGGRAGMLTVKQTKNGTWKEQKHDRDIGEVFRFDTGPSWYLMPDVFEHFFELLGEDVNKHLKLKRLNPSYQVFFKDALYGSVKIYGDVDKDGKTFESLEPGAHEKLLQFLDRSTYTYHVAMQNFLYKNYNGLLDFFTLKVIREGLKLNIFRSMQKNTSKYFTNPQLQKIIQYPLVFLGASPKNAPAMYSLMSHIDFNQGVFYPDGGMYSIVEALVAIAEKRGVTIKYNSPVERIITNNQAVSGVRVNGVTISADIVISNADIEHTERRLLKPSERMYNTTYWKQRTMAPSALLLYLGVKGSYPKLKHHNLVFSKDWDENFEQIFGGKKWPTDPSFYVCNPNETDKNVAPTDHENIFVLVPIAAGLRYNDEDLDMFSDKILETMETAMRLPGLRENIVYKKAFCVRDFESTYNSYKGTALGLSHTLKQTAVFRPTNAHRVVQNLYFVGANTTPGIGVPMCLISAELVYKRLIGDISDGPLTSLNDEL